MKQEELNKILESHNKWLNDKRTGERAVLCYADLKNTDFRNADFRNVYLKNTDFRNADFRNADFKDANLSGASFKDADLRNADFKNADLSGASFKYADLSGASFKDANLSGVIGNMKELRSMQIEVYTIAYTDTIMQIGCENHLINDWFKFDDGRILKMDLVKALNFWRKWKPILQLIIEDK